MAKQKSRADRLGDALTKVSEAKYEIEELRDELQNWLDNLPENLQSSMKADQLQEAIDVLDEIVSDCENLEARNCDVEFPSMF